MFKLLATVWVILVYPEGGDVQSQREIQNVHFRNLEDCVTAANQWTPELTDAAHKGKRSVTAFGGPKQPLPSGTVATYSCVEVERPW